MNIIERLLFFYVPELGESPNLGMMVYFPKQLCCEGFSILA